MMVKSRMRRLLTAINRRMMKLLIALALIAYVACECPFPHSFLASQPGPCSGGSMRCILGTAVCMARTRVVSCRLVVYPVPHLCLLFHGPSTLCVPCSSADSGHSAVMMAWHCCVGIDHSWLCTHCQQLMTSCTIEDNVALFFIH